MATTTVNLSTRPFFMQADVNDPPIYYTASQFRIINDALSPREGVLTEQAFKVIPASPAGWRITVQAGYAKVGNYLVHMSEPVTLNLTGFDTNPTSTRTHKVFLAVYDALYQGTEYTAKIIASEDTGAGAPGPVGATAALHLATFTIAKGNTAIVKANIDFTRLHGGAGSDRILLDAYMKTGFTGAAPETGGSRLRCWYQNNSVRFGGTIRRVGDGVAFAAGQAYEPFTVPEDYRPNFNKVLTGACSDGVRTFSVRFQPSGLVTCYIPPNTDPAFLYFDGLTYDLD